MARKTTSKKGSLRAFVERINSNHLARLQFLVDPIRALDEAGIQLDDEQKAELKALVHQLLENYPNAALLPMGLSRRSRKGKSKDTGEYKGSDDDDEVTIFFS